MYGAEARRPKRWAFAKNVEVVIPGLRRYARALTKDPEIADDLVQDTLLRAFRSEHLFHGDRLRSWLYTILINLNRNRLRSMARQPTFTSLQDYDAPVEAGHDIVGIERALEALAENQREALLLVVLEGLSYREVADVQGVPIGMVTSRLARARDEIKNVLESGNSRTRFLPHESSRTMVRS
jgi:RNA polymerase sigma-70 factor (ECF subfamily)